MAKASAARIAKKGKVATNRRNMSPQEVLELKIMNDLVTARKFEADQVAGNTALVPRGQDVAKELEAVARLLDNAKNMRVSQCQHAGRKPSITYEKPGNVHSVLRLYIPEIN